MTIFYHEFECSKLVILWIINLQIRAEEEYYEEYRTYENRDIETFFKL